MKPASETAAKLVLSEPESSFLSMPMATRCLETLGNACETLIEDTMKDA